MTTPELPQKVYLRRKEVCAAVGGRRQLAALERAGKVRAIRLPGYTRQHYTRASVTAALAELGGWPTTTGMNTKFRDARAENTAAPNGE